MELIIFAIVFAYSLVLWGIVLGVYGLVIEPIDFGYLPTFAWKSLLLVGVVALVVTFIPLGRFLTLIVWWVGIAVIFRMDFWECRMVVFLIWGINLLMSFAIMAMFSS